MIIFVTGGTGIIPPAVAPGTGSTVGSLKRSNKQSGKVNKTKKQKLGKPSVSSSSSAGSSNKDQNSANLLDFN